jgi:hypothetical protein
LGELLVAYGPAVFTVALAAALGVLVARSRMLAVLSGSVA